MTQDARPAFKDATMLRRTEVYQDIEPVRAVLQAVKPLFDDDNVISVTSRTGSIYRPPRSRRRSFATQLG